MTLDEVDDYLQAMGTSIMDHLGKDDAEFKDCSIVIIVRARVGKERVPDPMPESGRKMYMVTNDNANILAILIRAIKSVFKGPARMTAMSRVQ